MNYYNAELDRWFVLGVAGRGDYQDNSSVFTRVRSRLDFIRDYSGVVPIVTKSNTTDPTPEEITTTTTSPFTCAGKKNGNYPNPASNCSANFYTCSNGYASLSVSSQLLSKLLPLVDNRVYSYTHNRRVLPF
jgi:pancreatic elastase II